METTIVYCGHIGIMEKKMETTIVYWGYLGLEGNRGISRVGPCGGLQVLKMMQPFCKSQG